MAPLLSMRGIDKSFGGVPALRLHESRNVRIADSRGLPNRLLDQVKDGAFP